MSSGSGRRLSGVTAMIFTVLVIGCGTAFAAPPQDPPGNSGDAPGHQKQESDQPGPPATPPGQERKDTEPIVAPQAASAPAPAPAPASASNEPATKAKPAKSQPVHTSAPAESPRYTNGQGKPKRNVPAEAEAAPEASVSGPGNSGRHKVTVCHNGHGITVDVHAMAAHVGRHGDPYLPAGTKHRAACATDTSGPTRPPTVTKDPRDRGEMNDPREPDTPKNPVADPRTTSSTSQGNTSQSSTSQGSTSLGAPADPGFSADPGDREDREDPGASTSATHERSGSDSGTLAALPAVAQLPFTGAALTPLILIGLGLIGAGALLLRAGTAATPAAARARTSRRRRAAS